MVGWRGGAVASANPLVVGVVVRIGGSRWGAEEPRRDDGSLVEEEGKNGVVRTFSHSSKNSSFW